LVGWVALRPLWAGTKPAPMSEWKGEFFDRRQGGLYFKVVAKDFKASAQTRFLTGNAQVVVLNLLSKARYVTSVPLGDDGGRPREMWKIPSGKYEVIQVTLVDMAGVKRVWHTGKAHRQDFVVHRQCLSNLGLWTISPFGSNGLKLHIGAAPNTYKEAGAHRHSSVAAVLDGFTGLIQEKIGGKQVLEGARQGYGSQRELRATIKFTRQIAMFYKLNLFKFNYHAQAVANVLSVYDPNMRRCYTDRLAVNEHLRGDVKFTFLLSKQTGTMAKIRATGGSAASDPKLVSCVYYELAQIQFPVPENMIGELTYTYDVK